MLDKDPNLHLDVSGSPSGAIELFGNSTSAARNLETGILAIGLSTLIVLTFLGNICVITTILHGQFLKKPQYLLIFSLAFTDLLLGILVLPFSALYELVGQRWILGKVLCELWISFDVLTCTASIWHLVAIALDRYRAVQSVHYSRNRCKRSILTHILFIWLAGLVLALCPVFGWKDEGFDVRLSQFQCVMSQSISYQIFSTVAAFYVPLALICYLYWKILRTAKRRIMRHSHRRSTTTSSVTHMIFGERHSWSATGGRDSPQFINTAPSSVVGGEDGFECDLGQSATPIERHVLGTNGRFPGYPCANPDALPHSTESPLMAQLHQTQRAKAQKRERRATRTLVVLTGTFIVCWFPFFIMALIRPLCGCSWSGKLDSATLWLGYANSTLNPIIYTIFSPEFRQATRRTMKRCCRRNE